MPSVVTLPLLNVLAPQPFLLLLLLLLLHVLYAYRCA